MSRPLLKIFSASVPDYTHQLSLIHKMTLEHIWVLEHQLSFIDDVH
jgi:hypothetical protein